MREEMGQGGQRLLTATAKKYGELGWDEISSLLQRLQCVYSFSKSIKVVCSAHGAWCSPNTLLTMVHDKIFRIIYSLTPPLIRGSPIRHTGTHWATLWDWELETFTSTQSNLWLVISKLKKGLKCEGIGFIKSEYLRKITPIERSHSSQISRFRSSVIIIAAIGTSFGNLQC